MTVQRIAITLGPLLLIFGYLLGRIVTSHFITEEHSLHVTAMTGALVPIIEIGNVRDGFLEAEVSGTVRVFLQKKILLPDERGIIRIPSKQFLTQFITVHVPEWASFVASKKGTKYYSVGSSAGQNIVPGNRIYFHDEESAMNAGYSPGK